jgi:peptidyl-prolyl cis-trans isomerase C
LSPEEFTQQPVQTQFGWHIIKLNSTRPLSAPSWIDKKDEIKKKKICRKKGYENIWISFVQKQKFLLKIRFF